MASRYHFDKKKLRNVLYDAIWVQGMSFEETGKLPFFTKVRSYGFSREKVRQLAIEVGIPPKKGFFMKFDYWSERLDEDEIFEFTRRLLKERLGRLDLTRLVSRGFDIYGRGESALLLSQYLMKVAGVQTVSLNIIGQNMLNLMLGFGLDVPSYLLKRQYKHRWGELELHLLMGLPRDEYVSARELLRSMGYKPTKHMITQVWVTLHDHPYVSVRRMEKGSRRGETGRRLLYKHKLPDPTMNLFYGFVSDM